MHVLTRYVLLEYLLVFMLALVASTALLLFVGAALDLPKDIGAGEIVLMLPYLLPEAVRNAMQSSALFAACSVFGRLAAGNELLALSALGVSPLRVIRPVLLIAVLLSLVCVWLYDIGESWGQIGIKHVLSDSGEAIAYRYLRTRRTYTKGNITLNVKDVEGRKLVRPTLIMERPESESVTVSAEEGELRILGRDRKLSIVMRNGTVYVGDVASLVFPDAMQQTISLDDGQSRSVRWPPDHASMAGLLTCIEDGKARIAQLEQSQSSRLPPVLTKATHSAPRDLAARDDLQTLKQQVHSLRARFNRRWSNGFFCLAFVAIGVPFSMNVRSRDYLTSFFACFLPIVLLNHPLHNFCIKLAESGRGPAPLPWLGDILLLVVGLVMLGRLLRHA